MPATSAAISDVCNARSARPVGESIRFDATHVAVRVSGREVTLEGSVEDRQTKRLAEDVAESVYGVVDVHNRLQIAPRETAIDVDVQGPESHSGSGFLTENVDAGRTRPR